jgi:hypothetical protein
MPSIVATMKRILRRPLGRRQAGECHFSIIRDEAQLVRSSYLLAHHTDGSAPAIEELLMRLWGLNSTALHVEVQDAWVPADLVVSRHASAAIVARGYGFRGEAATSEPAPDGAYLDEREYRRLGFYEVPPSEQAIVVLRMVAGSGRMYLIDVPHYVSHVSIAVGNRVLANAAEVPARGELRYRVGAG